jgi:hypothetical protein
MSAIPEAKLELVRRVVGAAPDAAVRSLAAALASASGGGLAEVRDLVREEASERALRRAVLMPVLGTGAAVTMPVARFGGAHLGVVWNAVRRREPELLAQARDRYEALRPGDQVPLAFDEVCLAAASAVRDDPALAAALPADAAACLETAPLVRRALSRSGAWIGRPNPEEAAALRLILKDAAALAEDGVPRTLNLLATHLDEPCLVLRFISAALERPNDNYLASSELAGFGEALLTEISTGIEQVRSFNPALGPEAAKTAGQQVQTACDRIQEFETSLDLGRDGPWGKQVAELRRTLAAAVESRLRDVETAVHAALPTQTVRVAGRMTRSAPKLDAALDDARVDRARTLMLFLDGVRAAGVAGGFGSLRAKTAAKVAERLIGYADEALAAVNAFEVADEALALDHVALAAEFLVLADDQRAAQTVRRRAGVAGSLGLSRDSA